ncbi:MAG: FAD-dependent monooxygenase [Pseudomonadota bacterium]
MNTTSSAFAGSGEIYDLAVIGGGPAGSTLAVASAQLGLSVLLVDGRPGGGPARRDTRNFAVVRGSWRLLSRLGVAEALETEAEPLRGLEAQDGSGHLFSDPSALFGEADLDTDPTGIPLGYMVEAERLQAVLDARVAAQTGITVLRPARFDTYLAGSGDVASPASVVLEDGTCHRARLLAGCDGVNSPVRHAAGIGAEGRDYGKSVFAANVRLGRPHLGIARQLFTPEGPFATLPLPGDRANLAWYLKTGAAEALADRPVAEIEMELNGRFAEFAGEMAIDGPVLAYPLKLILARDMVGPRVALVGDAARRINPLAGQGLNLGFKDVAALAEVAADAVRAGLDPGSPVALERYRRWRRFDATMTALGMDMIDLVFSNDNPVLKGVRSVALLAADRMGAIRGPLTRQASADQASLPRLMQA